MEIVVVVVGGTQIGGQMGLCPGCNARACGLASLTSYSSPMKWGT